VNPSYQGLATVEVSEPIELNSEPTNLRKIGGLVPANPEN